MTSNLNRRVIVEIIGGVFFVILVIWFFFFRSTPALVPGQATVQQTFNTTDVGANTDNSGDNLGQSIASPISTQKVFKITDGPVAGAAFMQDVRPTTTIARFVMQQNGHVLDLAIDSPGSVARATSNTTIPGIAQVSWEVQTISAQTVAAGALLQYIDTGTVKTVLLNFPQAASTTVSTSSPQAAQAVHIQFLPDSILSVAASPDGNSVAYLLGTQSGSDGYVARYDGTNPKKLFSLPVSQVTLAWPSAGALLVTSKPAEGVAGITFSVDAKTGAVSPMIYAAGLSDTADASFSQVIYQTASDSGRITYSHNTKTNLDRPLSFNPIPEKCVWSRVQTDVMYCAAPLAYVDPSYLDLWHQGAASAADSLFEYNLITGRVTILATPGGADGGVASDVAQLSVSPDDKYLMFITKGDRTLWGVRLY